MTWAPRVLEKHVKWLLGEKLGEEGEKLWARYEATRNEFVEQILPWIAAYAPGLSDHGPRHIEDVIDNGGLLLGLNDKHGEHEVDCQSHDFSPREMFILLSGLLLHDVGNIYGREKHNLKIGEVWSKMVSWQLWPERERQLVINVGRAHSGKKIAGKPEDTIKGLDIHPQYFNKFSVRLGPIAAVIRFADELAEGPQRTSTFLVENKLIPEGSELHHHYAQIANPSIDRVRGRIALSFTISLDNPAYPQASTEQISHLTTLLQMAYSRAAKMNYERQYARHYAPVLTQFRETSISLIIYNEGVAVGPTLTPIVLADFSNSLEDSTVIEQADNSYAIASLVSEIGKEINAQAQHQPI